MLAGTATAALLELGLHFYFAGRAPRLAEWETIRPVVAELRTTPETLIVVAPGWAEPNARNLLGDAYMPLSHLARPDESGFEHALEISILGQAAPEVRGWRLDVERRAGDFTLRRWTNPGFVPVRYDFLAHLEPSEVAVEVRRGSKTESCRHVTTAKVTNGDLQGHPTFPRRRFACPGPEHFFVGRTVIEDQNYHPRACLWAHPPNRGTLVIRFGAVPIGARIKGYGGLPYIFEREIHGSPIELSVQVGDMKIGDWQHRDGEGWKGFDFATGPLAGQVLPVEFQIRSKKAWRREFCFQADVR